MAGGGGEITVVFEQSRGESADKGVAGAGGIDGLYLKGGDFEVAVGSRDETTALSEGHDHHGHAKRAAELMELRGRKSEQCFFGKRFVAGWGKAIGQFNEFGFVGNQNIDVFEDRRFEVGPHGGGVEDRQRFARPPDFQGFRGGGEVCFELSDDDLGLPQGFGGQVGFAEFGVGREGHKNLVLTLSVDHDGRGAGGLTLFHRPFCGNTFGFVKGPGVATEGVFADRADVEGGGARPPGSDGLIGSFAPGAGLGGGHERFAGAGEVFAGETKIFDVASNDNNLGFGLSHGGSIGMKAEVRSKKLGLRQERGSDCRLSCEEHRLSKDCDFGGMLVYGDIVSDSVPPFENLLIDAKRQKARGRLYVICQLVGFSVLFGAQLFFAHFFKGPGTDYGSLSFTDILTQFHSVFIGLVVTHFSRGYIDAWGWKEHGWLKLIPRMVGMAVAMAVIWVIFVHGWYFGVLRNDYPEGILPPILFLVAILNSSFIVMGWLSVYFIYHVFDRFNRSEIERLRLAAVVKDAELRALKSQVNPHFIFNSLNSVRALIDEDPQRARSAVTQLANMLRYSLQSGSNQTVPFEDELTVVNDYLALEQVRHEERLRLKLDIAPGTLRRILPPMLLQTLVENAVKYGISTRASGGEISIAARIENHDLLIEVRNPGHLSERRSRESNGSTGLGLRNALDRLQLLCGDNATIDLRQTGSDEVTATVIVPQSNAGPTPPRSKIEPTTELKPVLSEQ